MISYPLTIPGALGPASADLQMFDAIGEFTGEFDGSAEQQQWSDQHWTLDMEWPPQTWAQGAALDAFLAALHGKWGSFLWGPPWAASPRGSALLAGSPVCTGADAARSNCLHTSAWLPNQSGILLPGDYFSLGGPVVQSLTPIFTSLGPLFAALSVTGGILTLILPAAFGTALLSSLPGQQVTFAGLTNAANLWINGLTLEVITAANIPSGLGLFQQGELTLEVSEANYASAQEDTGTVTLLFLTRLYQYVNPNPLTSDGGGNATLDIFPALREAPPAGASLILVNPQGTFRLAENLRKGPFKANKTVIFAMKCREAI
jgi:hypothetical protein